MNGTLVKRNHWVIRVTHWVNVVAIVIMAGSGMRIFNAHPSFGRPGERFALNPWEGHSIPPWLTFGGWLGGARHWHFAAMWLLLANAALYLGFLALHGEWRDIAPRRGDLRDAVEMLKFYLYIRRDHPHQGKHNALQKSAYFIMPVLGAVIVVSGIAIWKPVSMNYVTALFVNYKWARVTHFAAMVALLALALVHVFMVFAVDPWSLRSMASGWYDRTRSPQARNARPFHHVFARGDALDDPATDAAPSPAFHDTGASA